MFQQQRRQQLAEPATCLPTTRSKEAACRPLFYLPYHTPRSSKRHGCSRIVVTVPKNITDDTRMNSDLSFNEKTHVT